MQDDVPVDIGLAASIEQMVKIIRRNSNLIRVWELSIIMCIDSKLS